jgi:hypothetical protein
MTVVPLHERKLQEAEARIEVASSVVVEIWR